VNDLPALQNHGYITFGSFNSAAKFNSPLFALWANVLHAIPHSRLLLMTKSFKDSTARQLVLEALTKLGISSERVILDYAVTTEDTLAAYHRVDIALDTYPFNGATTTCQALWMGIPVITLVGQTPAARAGLSILSTVGFQEWIAYTPAEYLDICRKLCQNLEYLQNLRQQIRLRMQSSPVLDGGSYTRHLETIYQHLWKRKLHERQAVGELEKL
jgi:predicted O-linked N-acetylglucosamine transferase (SPINDLY family)